MDNFQLTESKPLIDYRFATDPGPLQSGTVNQPVSARITISAPAVTPPVYCNRIKIAVPIGDSADAFSTDAPSPAVSTANWTIRSSVKLTGAELGEHLPPQTNFAVYTFETRDKSNDKIDYNLVLELSGTTNNQPGTFTIQIQETSGTSSDPSKYTVKTTSVPLQKNSPEFYVRNFIATNPASPLEPCSEFANGGAIRLSWESNGTWFQLFRKNDAKVVWEGNSRYHELPAGIANDTTFILSACVIGKAGGGSNDFRPIYIYDSITLTVSNPDLSVRNLVVNGTTKLIGALEVAGLTKLRNTESEGSQIMNGMLVVKDKTTLQSTRIEGSLTVTGATELSDITFKKGLNIPSASVTQLTAGSATISANASVNGQLDTSNVNVRGAFTISGSSSCINSGEGWVKPGKYTAQSDLLLTASISGQGDGGSFGYVSIKTPNKQVNASGGHVLGPPGWSGYNMNGSCSAFVRKGEEYELILVQEKNNVNYAFYRWSLGAFNESSSPR